MINRQIGSWIFLFFLCGNISAQTEFTDTPRIKSMEDMLTFAVKHQRKPYKTGAEGPYAFDCSGFTRYCYKQIGIDLKRSSKEQAENGKKVRQKKLKEGDLIFFKGSSGKEINHVGIVYKKKSGKNFEFIHASTSSGIIIESNETEYFRKRYVTARRVTSDKKIRNTVKTIEKENKASKKQQKKMAKLEAKRKKELEKEQKNTLKETNQTTLKSFDDSHYTVKKGDTLYNISKRFNCTVEDLRRWNKLKNNDIMLGQELIVK
jgi:LysM repeat protein